MKFILIFLVIFYLSSCSSENESKTTLLPEQDKASMVEEPGRSETGIDKIIEPLEVSNRFIEGTWKHNSDIESLKNGNLDLTQDWTHFRTIYDSLSSTYKFYIQHAMDATEFTAYPLKSGGFRLDETGLSTGRYIKFVDDNIILKETDTTYTLVQINQPQPSKEFYFTGDYTVLTGYKPLRLSLSAEGGLKGNEKYDAYDAHFGYSEPVFEFYSKGKLIETLIIEDTHDGFNLYECMNCEDIDGIDFPVEVGGLKLEFIKD